MDLWIPHEYETEARRIIEKDCFLTILEEYHPLQEGKMIQKFNPKAIPEGKTADEIAFMRFGSRMTNIRDNSIPGTPRHRFASWRLDDFYLISEEVTKNSDLNSADQQKVYMNTITKATQVRISNEAKKLDEIRNIRLQELKKNTEKAKLEVPPVISQQPKNFEEIELEEEEEIIPLAVSGRNWGSGEPVSGCEVEVGTRNDTHQKIEVYGNGRGAHTNATQGSPGTGAHTRALNVPILDVAESLVTPIASSHTDTTVESETRSQVITPNENVFKSQASDSTENNAQGTEFITVTHKKKKNTSPPSLGYIGRKGEIPTNRK